MTTKTNWHMSVATQYATKCCSIGRQVLTFAGTALGAKGYIQTSNVEPVIGTPLAFGSVVWS
jgi:hypothetical protein